MIGTNAFQETPIIDVTHSITKHSYLILDINNIPHIIKDAFFLAFSGCSSPVLIIILKDI